MIFEQMYLGCLAQASYFIGSGTEAAVVDPRRDVDVYIAEAQKHGMSIKYVIETHLHADFVSGHRELAERTGATIVIGRAANAEFPHLAMSDGDRLALGDLSLRFLETPGHTPESVSVVVSGSGQTEKVLTGDTLFIGDVGRPDLAGGAGYTPAQMAGMLYDSLHGKLLVLGDDVEVYPAHGAGSLCGKNMSKETSSTIGVQRRVNYALRPMPKEAFIELMTSDFEEAPAYFSRDVQLNRRGADRLSSLSRPAALSVDAARTRLDRGAIVLDVRSPDAFGAAHVPGSVNIGLAGQYASWAGALLHPAGDLLLVVARDEQVEEAVVRLARVGLENAYGYIAGGVEAWQRSRQPVAAIPQITVHDLHELMESVPELQVVDVRRAGEYRDAHARGAQNIPLHELLEKASSLDAGRPTAVICAGGYRSSIGTGLLERLGFSEIHNVIGGTTAWQAAGLPTVR